MLNRTFVCLNPNRAASMNCGHTHHDLREAMVCHLERVAADRDFSSAEALMYPYVARIDDTGDVRFDESSREDVADDERAILRRLGCNTTPGGSAEEILRRTDEDLVALRADLEQHPPFRPPTSARARRTNRARKAA